MSVLARIVFKTTLWLGRFHVIRTVDRLISCFKRALAVPSVARVMVIPERIINRQRESHLPVLAMAAFRVR